MTTQHTVRRLRHYKLQTTDGNIGHVEAFYFEDHSWLIRYLVVHTGHWLTQQSVLIAPIAVKQIDDAAQVIEIRLSQEQVKHSPPVSMEKPISRQYEERYFLYYGWPFYWQADEGEFLDVDWVPATSLPWEIDDNQLQEVDDEQNTHLRSTDEVNGYYLETPEGGLGHIEDFIIDDRDWTIRYLEVDTRNFWPGKKVLIAPQWITQISWLDRKVFVNLSRQLIQTAPAYDPQKPIDSEYEHQLKAHYGR